jgi:plastocyanin
MGGVCKQLVRAVGALVLGSLAACGASPDDASTGPQTPIAPSPAPEYRWPLTATVRITRAGPEPSSVIVNVGGRVTFVNDDVRPHEVVSDPHLRHDDCPAINRVGFLSPGQQGETAVFEAVSSCGFHDHLDPASLVGRIEIRIE